MLAKLKKLMEWANTKGVPVPLARYKGKPTVSFSLLILSALFVGVSLALPKVISFWNALSWHCLCAVLYYQRDVKISKDLIEISSHNTKGNNEQEGSEP